MSDWTNEDYALVRQAREGISPVLEDLNPFYLPHRAPTIEVVCSDWTRRYEMVTHLAQMRGYERHEDPEVHLLGWHAGPVRLFTQSPANREGDYGTFTREVIEAIQITGILDVNLHGHWPCKKCRKHNMQISDSWRTMLCLPELQRLIPNAHIRTLFHIDYEDRAPGKMKNYRLHPGRCSDLLAVA